MAFTVQLDGYPSRHHVTGVERYRGETGRRLWVAVADVRMKGRTSFRARDVVTLMMLADIWHTLTGETAKLNAPAAYGRARSNQELSAKRIRLGVESVRGSQIWASADEPEKLYGL